MQLVHMLPILALVTIADGFRNRVDGANQSVNHVRRDKRPGRAYRDGTRRDRLDGVLPSRCPAPRCRGSKKHHAEGDGVRNSAIPSIKGRPVQREGFSEGERAVDGEPGVWDAGLEDGRL